MFYHNAPEGETRLIDDIVYTFARHMGPQYVFE